MTARLTTICLLFAGCSSLGSSKKPGDFTAADRKFFKEAETHVDASMTKGDPKGSGFLAMGQFYVEVKKLTLAERMFQKVLEGDPKCVAAYAGMAQCHSLQGRTEQAAAALDKGFALDPKSHVLWNEAAVLRAKTGDMDGAVEAAKKAYDAAPTSTLYAENLGTMLAMTGRYGPALEVYAKAFNMAEAHYRVALILKDKGDLRGAEQNFKSTLRHDPQHQFARRHLASSQAGDQGAVRHANYETSSSR
jgi:tetratricopeptide (TPR) repeat protein